MSKNSKKAWCIVTPKGKMELDSIQDTRKECIRHWVLHAVDGGLRGTIENHWGVVYLSHGYRCIKVIVTKVKPE